MNAERDGSRRQNPYPQRPEIHLARQTNQRWTLTDSNGCIEADVEVDDARQVTRRERYVVKLAKVLNLRQRTDTHE
jgi:hypothetical protein